METEIVKSQENEVQLFTNEEFGKIRTIILNGEPWFVGKDVAEALGYSNTKDALKKHVFSEDKSVFQRSQFATLEIPNRGMTFVNEAGLYSLIFGSKLEKAKKFKHWVTSEVLPTLRKTGKYEMNSNVDMTAMLDKIAKIDVIYAKLDNLETLLESQKQQKDSMEETLQKQDEKLSTVMENMTLTTVQQGTLQRAVKDRVNFLLGGAHSERYKTYSRLYFANLWNGLKAYFDCGSRWQDLNPKYLDEAVSYVDTWEYVE